MAWPFLFESTFDGGSNAEWTSESDTGSLLDFPHFSDLARLPHVGAAPYRGAYCARLQLGDTNDHTVKSTSIAYALDATFGVRFYINFLADFDASADDIFNIFEMQETGNASQLAVTLKYTAATDAIGIAIHKTAASSFTTYPFQRGRWYCIEVSGDIDAGGGNDGAAQLYVDGEAVGAALASLDQAAVTHGVLGSQDTLATTTGTVLLDWLIADDARVYPESERFPVTSTITKSTHVFVGPGTVDSAALLSSTSGNYMQLYDTDRGYSSTEQDFIAELALTANIAIEGPLVFKRGCYAKVTGTNPRGQVIVSRCLGGPTYYSASGIRRWGQIRKERPLST